MLVLLASCSLLGLDAEVLLRGVAVLPRGERGGEGAHAGQHVAEDGRHLTQDVRVFHVAEGGVSAGRDVPGGAGADVRALGLELHQRGDGLGVCGHHLGGLGLEVRDQLTVVGLHELVGGRSCTLGFAAHPIEADLRFVEGALRFVVLRERGVHVTAGCVHLRSRVTTPCHIGLGCLRFGRGLSVLMASGPGRLHKLPSPSVVVCFGHQYLPSSGLGSLSAG